MKKRENLIGDYRDRLFIIGIFSKVELIDDSVEVRAEAIYAALSSFNGISVVWHKPSDAPTRLHRVAVVFTTVEEKKKNEELMMNIAAAEGGYILSEKRYKWLPKYFAKELNQLVSKKEKKEING